jgi:hypothetical protein
VWQTLVQVGNPSKKPINENTSIPQGFQGGRGGGLENKPQHPTK